MASNYESNSSSATSVESLLDELPQHKLFDTCDIYQWEGFWYESRILEAALVFKSQFIARDDDFILASTVKTGTTWLKALCLSILHGNPDDKNKEEEILKKGSPHMHVPTIESMIFEENRYAIIEGMPSPRLIHTHLPYNFLSDSVKNSKCKIFYITRNPKDTFISWWHFMNSILRPNEEPFPLEKAFDCFSKGVYIHGPFFDHVLRYWKASLEMPERILFLTYEELKIDPTGQVKKLASFLGKSVDEVEVDDILWKCSFERLKNLEVNKNGYVPYNGLLNASFYRKGVIEDSRNYLTPDMEENLSRLCREKFQGSGLNLYL